MCCQAASACSDVNIRPQLSIISMALAREKQQVAIVLTTIDSLNILIDKRRFLMMVIYQNKNYINGQTGSVENFPKQMWGAVSAAIL